MIWDDFLGNNTYNRHYINNNSHNNWYTNLWHEMNRMMNDALDEVDPPKPKTKVVSTKVVKRNGKLYRITVEQILPSEVEDTEATEESEDFEPDFTEDNA